MANRDQDQTHKKPYHASKPRSGQSRILEHLGVSDLREVLDRKRTERAHETGVPPPDPSYNYLKDPLREDKQDHSQQSNPMRKHHSNRPFQREKDHWGQRNNDIENPCNIKVEFSTETGQRSYKVDESTVLPTIKHVPDHAPYENRPFRGRGRGRGRGPRTYNTRTIRNNALSRASGPPKVLDAGENWDDECEAANKEDCDGAQSLEKQFDELNLSQTETPSDNDGRK